MYTNILVPIDESLLSMSVIDRAVALGQLMQARVAFVHLSPDEQDLLQSDAGLLHAMAPEMYARKYVWGDLAVQARAMAWAGWVGVEAGFVSGVARGSVSDRILATARDQASDLIVMASHGRGGVLKKVFESVTLKVILHSRLPIFIVETGLAAETESATALAHFVEAQSARLALADETLGRILQGDTSAVFDDPHVLGDVLSFLLDGAGEVEAGLIHRLETAWSTRSAASASLLRTAAQDLRDGIAARITDEKALLEGGRRFHVGVSDQSANNRTRERRISREDEFVRLLARLRGMHG